ncbi:MAG: YraN family protein [Acutalibacteraceae bacterium]|nr:YraN family protein [Acutalibacteraceae bacterium]
MKYNKEKTEKRKTGDIGENFTCEYLLKLGYKILDRNYSCRYGELDIVAVNNTHIAFVEVKTRHENPMIRPCLAVDKRKQIKIMRVAYLYLKAKKLKLQPRFDIAEVYLKNNSDELHHINYIKNAFIQEGDYASF